jgi:hypothetical protein
MSNIFNDTIQSQTIGKQLTNIGNLSVADDSVIILNGNNNVESKAISTYAQDTLLSLQNDAEFQTIANNASPVGYSTIYTENISKLTPGDVNLNIKPIAESPLSTTDSYKSSLTFWGTFYANADDAQPRASAKIQSGFFAPDNAWGGQEIRFYVGGGTYDNGNIQNFPGYYDSSLRFQIADNIITTRLSIRPNADNTIDLGYDGNPGGLSAGDTGDLWYRNSFIRNMYYQNLYEISDERLKTDIQPIPSALGSLLKIQTKRYRYKNDPSKLRFGVIAQQIQTLFSDEYAIVNERENGMSVNYKEFIPLLIKSIQELARNRSKNIPDDVNVVEVPREDPKQDNMFGSILDRIMKLEKMFSTGVNIVESVEEVISSTSDFIENDKLDDILARVEKLENKHHHSDSDGESDGFDIMGKLQTDIYELNQRLQKQENKMKKMTTLVNKIAKQS